MKPSQAAGEPEYILGRVGSGGGRERGEWEGAGEDKNKIASERVREGGRERVDDDDVREGGCERACVRAETQEQKDRKTDRE